MTNYNRRADKRTQSVVAKVFIRSIILVVLVFAIIFGGVIISRNVAAASAPNKDKIYTSYEIKSGDTLWRIASRYCDDSALIEDYIDEVKQINGMMRDTALMAGKKLIIYYYE